MPEVVQSLESKASAKLVSREYGVSKAPLYMSPPIFFGRDVAKEYRRNYENKTNSINLAV